MHFKYNWNSININKYKFYCTASNDYGNNVLGFARTRYIWDVLQLLVQKNGTQLLWCKEFFVLVLINRFSLACDVRLLTASLRPPFQLGKKLKHVKQPRQA